MSPSTQHRNPSLTRWKRVGAPVGRRSRPESPLLKWKIEDRVVNVDDEDGGEAAGEEEKKNGGSKGRRRSVKVVSARRLAAGLWRLQLPETVVGGGGQRRRSRKDLVGFQDGFDYAEKNGIFFIETSAKTADNINQLFEEIAKRIPRPSASS